MRFTEVLTSHFARLRTGAIAVALGVLAGATTPALAQDNPLGLIDPAVISVGTMGDAKPYA
ncbi:MAG: amino acid ABC transporter substrate-binding protein, partial [Shinella sp.]